MDGYLYEFSYYAQASWLSNELTYKCRKLNHSTSTFTQLLPSFLLPSTPDSIIDIAYDHSRAYLYTLSKQNIVNCYYVDYENGSVLLEANMRNLLQVSRDHLLKNHRTPTAITDWDPQTFRVVSISPIAVHQATEVIACVITNHGHRIYLRKRTSAKQLDVRFIRLCPSSLLPNAKNRNRCAPDFNEDESPKDVSMALYKNDVFVLVDTLPDKDALITINTAPNISRMQIPQLHESIEVKPMVDSRQRSLGHIFAIAERPSNLNLTVAAASLYASESDSPLTGLSEFATQHALPRRQFLVLTRHGLLSYSRRRPVDELKSLLKQYKLSRDPSETVSIHI